MNNFISITRPLNLIIVAVSQLLIYYLFIAPSFEEYKIERVLDNKLVLLFVVVTILIAASGYIINDIKDIATDVLNKPSKTYIGAGKITTLQAYIFYYTLIIVGGIIAAYIALQISKPFLFLIYPAAVFLLYKYSSSWKKQPLSGNIVVAIFCAFVPAIIWYAEAKGMHELHEENSALTLLFASYILFGFFATMTREIIKDIEDIAGDQQAGFKTLPITAGVDRAKVMALINMLILTCTYGLWLLAIWRLQAYVSLALFVVLQLLPSLYILTKITNAQDTNDYSQLSKYLKILMAVSLIIFTSILLES